jgi:hypothetical protein
MKSRTLICALTLAGILAAAIPSRSQEPHENPLNQLAWMVGGKWQADAAKGPDGKPFHAEWKCQWGANHRTLEFTVWFLTDGRLVPVYNGLYAWNPAKKKVIFVYTDNKGAFTEGETVMRGNRLEQDFHIIGADGISRPFRSTIIRQGNDRYDWSVLSSKDGVWTEMFSLRYTRSRD